MIYIKDISLWHGNCLELMKGVNDESVDLIIADPPYFKVVGEKWDYMWRTEEDYLEWSKCWIAEASRVLRKGGTFYLFGYFRMLSRLLPIIENSGLELRQQIILNKGIQMLKQLNLQKSIILYMQHVEYLLMMYQKIKIWIC